MRTLEPHNSRNLLACSLRQMRTEDTILQEILETNLHRIGGWNQTNVISAEINIDINTVSIRTTFVLILSYIVFCTSALGKFEIIKIIIQILFSVWVIFTL